MAFSVLIVDDHQLFLDGLQLMLNDNETLNIVGACKNGREVLDFLSANSTVDLVLLDINMPVMNGYETSLEMQKLYPTVKIIALSTYVEHTNITKMLEAGVMGYVYKNADADTLTKAIQEVMNEQYYIEEEAQYILKEYLEHVKDEQKGYYKFKHFELTQREKEIVILIMDGFTNQEIADKLFLSNRTVDTHRNNVLNKLDLKNTATLVKYAMENKEYLGID